MARKGVHEPKINLIGKKFGKLTVIEYAGYRATQTGKIHHQWKCACDCGGEKIATTMALTTSHCKSCGCMSHAPHHLPQTKHHLSDTRIYNVWKSMKGRCYTKSNSAYCYYGARGITVCDEWKNDFSKFYEWAIANGYKEVEDRNAYTIDRIDVNGNYEPSNCRWITMQEQSNNRRNNNKYMFDGEILTLREIAEKTNTDYSLLNGRITRGCSIYEAVYGTFEPAKYHYIYEGERRTIPEISKLSGVKEVTIRSRLSKGYTIEEATKQI